MNRSSIIETLVGFIVLVVAGGFAAYAYGRGDFEITQGGYRVNGNFGRVDGVGVGADVRIAGVKVGSVARQSLDPETYEAKVEMIINENVKIPTDSVAKVTMDGLLGGSYVAIEPGAEFEYMEAGGSFLYTQGSVDLISLATRAFLDNSAKQDDGGGGDSSGDGEGEEASDDNPFDLPDL